MNQLYETKYTGIGGKSYITFQVPATEELNEYQIEMLAKNSIVYLLPLTIRRINRDYIFSHEITSKISLGKLLERKSLKTDEFEYIIKQIGQLSVKLKNYLLDVSSILFDKYCVYCDPADLSLYFIYLPLRNNKCDSNNIKVFLQKLIVEDIRLQDDSSGSLLKRLLDALKADTFTPEQLLLCIKEKPTDEQIAYKQLSEYEERLITEQKNYLGNENKGNSYIRYENSQNNHYSAPQSFEPRQAPPWLELFSTKHEITSDKHRELLSEQSDRLKSRSHRAKNNIINNAKSPEQSKRDIIRNKTYPELNKGQEKQGDRNLGGNINFIRNSTNQSNLGSIQTQSSIIDNLNYPLKSFIIAGLVNITFISILIYILLTSTNTKNLFTTIIGLLLTGLAINYFLITRLFSEDKKQTKTNSKENKYSYNKNKTLNKTENSFTGKRFVNNAVEEDIILPKMRSSSSRAWAQSHEKNEVRHKTEVENSGSGILPYESDEIQKQGKVGNSSSKVLPYEANEWQRQNDSFIPKNMDSLYLGSDNLSSSEIRVNSNTDRKESTLISKINTIAKFDNDEFPSDNTIILGTASGNQPYLQSHSCPSEKIIITKPSLLLGRLADSVDYTIQNKAVGKIHSEIVKKEDNYYITDLNSVNGTYINNERIICNTEAQIKNGDIITFANESYTFVL